MTKKRKMKGGFMSVRKNNYYYYHEDEEEEEEEGSTGEEEDDDDDYQYHRLGLGRRRRQFMCRTKDEELAILEEEDLAIQRAPFLSDNSNFKVQSHSPKKLQQTRDSKTPSPNDDDDDVKMKGVDNSCTLRHVFFYNPYRSGSVRGRGGPSSATCVICMDVKSISDTLQSPKCSHRFCKDCIEVYLADKIQEDIIRVKCPESKCEIVLGMEFCEGIIPKEVFDRWKVALQESSVLESPRRIRCPFEECSAMFLDDGRNYLTRACPKCWRIFCMRCKVSWHLGKTCDTFQRTRYHHHHLLPPGYLMFLRNYY